jgi:hypothetical protein
MVKVYRYIEHLCRVGAKACRLTVDEVAFLRWKPVTHLDLGCSIYPKAISIHCYQKQLFFIQK